MFTIKNREEIVDKLVDMLVQFDKDCNSYQTDVYLYYDKENQTAELDTFVNVGGNSYSLAEIDLDGTMTYDSMAGEATVKILGGLVTGKAGISIDWKTDCLEGHGNLSVANLATISAGFKINSSGSFMVQGTQSVDLTKYGLGVAYNSNVMVQYIKDNTSTNDYYVSSFFTIMFDSRNYISRFFFFSTSAYYSDY